MQLSNTHLPTLQRVKEWFGGSIWSAGKPRADAHRQSFKWEVKGKAAVSVCERVLPYLYEKRDQAVRLIEFGCYRGHARHPRRAEIIDELKTLKRPEWAPGDINVKGR